MRSSDLASFAAVSPGVVFRRRADFSFEFVSSPIEEWTGVPAAEWLRRPPRFWQVVHEADVEELERHIKRATETAEVVQATFRLRNRATGRVAHVLEQRRAVRDDSGEVIAHEGVWLDLTHQVLLEERLHVAAWKETVSMLTRSFVHDLNNLLAGLLPVSDALLASHASDDPVNEEPVNEGLALLKKNLVAASQLMARLGHLQRAKPTERNYLDLNGAVTDLKDLVERALGRRTSVEWESATDALPVFVDAVELQQAILYVVSCLAEAMPKGGTLRLRTSGHPQGPPQVHAPGRPAPARAVCLALEPVGSGGDEAELARLFALADTRAAADGGAGFTVRLARALMEKNDGALVVELQPGSGLHVQFWLPEADFTEGERERQTGVSGRRSLLCVGLEDTFVDRVVPTLWAHGYQIAIAASGQVAAEWLQSPGHRFAGLIVSADLFSIDAESSGPEQPTPQHGVAAGDASCGAAPAAGPAGPFAGARLRDATRQSPRPVKFIVTFRGRSAPGRAAPSPGKTDLLLDTDLAADEILKSLNTVFKPERIDSHDNA
ncbi:MAG: PAS domain-containing protein [Verrucomicrobia bacterium]|nr:PAS domain-containing protein [Verrucomicrobiota bacterium]